MALLTFSMSAMAGEITVYTALEDDQYPVYLESFKQQYPDIKLNIVRDSTGQPDFWLKKLILRPMWYGVLRPPAFWF